MSQELDSLEIRLSADTSRASRAIDTLNSKLSTLSTTMSSLNGSQLSSFADGVQKLSGAMASMQNIKSWDFTNMAKGLQKLASLGGANLNTAATNINSLSDAITRLSTNMSTGSTEQLTTFTQALSRLGGVGVERAIAQIPLLADALNKAMVTLSKAPKVSSGVTQLVNALANLASQSGRVNTANRQMTSTFARVGSSAKKHHGIMQSLMAIYGKFASLRFIVNMLKGAWEKTVKQSMSYIETLNYFNATMEQVVSKADLSQWETLGYKSAEEYANSFSKRLQNVSEKMTGFTVSDNGMLLNTRESSLGLEPSKLLSYQTSFTQIASSMGVASDTAVKLSQALTEIGADLASVKNMEFEDVWQNMASGLVGMSRAVDKYGVNIRNANMQTMLTKLGIEGTVTSLSQADKAILRTIILLDSSRYAWGDLSDTISQPANQLRLLQSAFTNLARTIGNIFLPIAASLLPYLIAITQALQMLAERIVVLLGFAGFDWGGSAGASTSMDSLLDSVYDLDDGLDSANSSAKALKRTILGFDELNVMNKPNESSGSGGGAGISGDLSAALDDILNEYQLVWDQAYANMTLNSKKFANDLLKSFEEGGFQGAGRFIADTIASGLSNIDWKKTFATTENIGTSFAEFINGIMSPDLFAAVGKTIANSINNALVLAYSIGATLDGEQIGEAFASGLNQFFESFDFGLLAKSLNVWVDNLEDAIGGFLKNFSWKNAFKSAGDFFANIELDTIGVIIGLLTINKVKTIVFSALSGLSQAMGNAIGDALVNSSLTLDVGTLFGAGTFAEIGATLGLTLIGGFIAAVGGWFVGQWLYEIISGEDIKMSFGEQMSEIFKSFSDGVWADAFKLWGKDIADAFKEMFVELKRISAEGLQDMVDGWNWLRESIIDWLDRVKKGFEDWWADIKPILEFFGAKFEDNTTKITKRSSDSIHKWSNDSKNDINGFTSETTNKLGSWEQNSNKLFGKFQTEGTNAFSNFNNNTTNQMNTWSTSLNNTTNGAMDNVYTSVGGGLEKTKKLFDFNWSLPPVKAPHFKVDGEFSLMPLKMPKVSIDWYEQGGYPNMGDMFIARESGPELVGTMGNRNAVANNIQIIEGIKQGVAEAMMEVAMATSSGNSNGSVEIPLIIDGKELGRVAAQNIDTLIQTGKIRPSWA